MPSALSEEQPRTLGLSEFWHILRLHRWLFFVVTGLSIALGLGIITQLRPYYQARAELLVSAPAPIIEFKAIENTHILGPDLAALEGELEIIKSDRLAEEVIRILDLAHHPEFNPASEPALPMRLIDDARSIITWLSVQFSYAMGHPKETLDDEGSDLIELITDFRSRLSASIVGGSRVIRITFTADDPRLAANVLNALVAAYVEQQRLSKQGATEQARDLLEERLKILRNEMIEAERALAEYREDREAPAAVDPTAIGTQLSRLTEGLATARADLREAQARLSRLEAIFRTHGAEAAAEVVASERMDEIRNRIELKRQQLSELSKTYGARHPLITTVTSELRSAEEDLLVEARRQQETLRYEAEAARERVASLGESIAQLTKVAAGRDWANVDLVRLEREAAARKQLFEAVLERLKQTEQQLGSEQPDAEVVNWATIPADPSGPNRKLFFMLTLGTAALLGGGSVLLREAAVRGLLTPTEAQRRLGVTCYGSVPDVRASGPHVPNLVVARPNSPYSEAVRAVCVSLIRRKPRQEIGAVTMIASSVAREGKTTLCASIALNMAMSGLRVLAIDADLRRPLLGEMLACSGSIGKGHFRINGVPTQQLKPAPDLVAYLRGESSLEDVMTIDPSTGLCYLPTIKSLNYSEDLLRCPRLGALLSRARKSFDYVLIDAPPLLPVADALILGSFVDGALFSVRWNATPAALARRALQELERAGVPVFGMVLLQADRRWLAKYDLEYYAKYQKRDSQQYYDEAK